MSAKSYGLEPAEELQIVENALSRAIDLGGLLQDIEGSVPDAMDGLNACTSALLRRKRELFGAKSASASAPLGAHKLYG